MDFATHPIDILIITSSNFSWKQERKPNSYCNGVEKEESGMKTNAASTLISIECKCMCFKVCHTHVQAKKASWKAFYKIKNQKESHQID